MEFSCLLRDLAACMHGRYLTTVHYPVRDQIMLRNLLWQSEQNAWKARMKCPRNMPLGHRSNELLQMADLNVRRTEALVDNAMAGCIGNPGSVGKLLQGMAGRI